MARSFSDSVRKMNEDLKKMLAEADRPKQRVTFHKSSAAHGAKSKTARNRNDRRRGRQTGWAA